MAESALTEQYRRESVAELVAQARKHHTELRRLLQAQPARNVGATESAIQWRDHDLHLIQAELMRRGERDLVGLLVEESSLAGRVSRARQRADLSHDVDHLKRRLNAIRLDIRLDIRDRTH